MCSKLHVFGEKVTGCGGKPKLEEKYVCEAKRHSFFNG